VLGSVPFVTVAGVDVVNAQKDTNPSSTFVQWGFTPTAGNVLLLFVWRRGGSAATDPAAPAGWQLLEANRNASSGHDSVLCFAKVSNGTETSAAFTADVGYPHIVECSGVSLTDLETATDTAASATTAITTGTVTPAAGRPALIFGSDAISNDTFTTRTHTPGAGWTELRDADPGQTSAPFPGLYYKEVVSTTGSYTPSATASAVGGAFPPYWRGITIALLGAVGGLTWISAPETVDESDASSVDVDSASIAAASDVLWRGDLEASTAIGEFLAVIGFTSTGTVTVVLQGGDQADYSDATDVVTVDIDATGSLTADELARTFDAQTYRYWQLVLDSGAEDVRVYEVTLGETVVIPPTEPGKAILEIYVHDENASKWGEATWATGPATGTEGIWSAAGWQDITPQGVNAHILWGSRRPELGILSEQNGATWQVETYDPDGDLDPGNADSPWYPQLLAGVPIRISHNTLVIRTGYVDRWSWKRKRPDYQGSIQGSDTIALMNQAKVPDGTFLADALYDRIQEAIDASGIAVGGIPLASPSTGGPDLAPEPEGDFSLWDVVKTAAEEVLYIPYIDNAAGLQLRAWGSPLDRAREIGAGSLEDLETVSAEDGLYSVAVVQPADLMDPPIEREAAPLPRYGRRVLERTEATFDAEAWADAVLQERAQPGVQYNPGTVWCFTAEDVDYYGSIEIMERVTITIPGAVQVQARVLGTEMWVEHRAQATKGADWKFLFYTATDGSTAIGIDTLVSDQAGDTLLDDASGLDYLEAD
jgi:hypothetical protein